MGPLRRVWDCLPSSHHQPNENKQNKQQQNEKEKKTPEIDEENALTPIVTSKRFSFLGPFTKGIRVRVSNFSSIPCSWEIQKRSQKCLLLCLFIIVYYCVLLFLLLLLASNSVFSIPALKSEIGWSQKNVRVKWVSKREQSIGECENCDVKIGVQC